MENRFEEITVDAIRNNIAAIKPETELSVYKECFSLIDLTSLNTTDNKSRIESICQKVNNFNSAYPGLKNVAAICVFPNFISSLKANLKTPGVKIVSVAASFPSSQTFREIKLAECSRAIKEGADEIDIVISLGELLDNNPDIVSDEIKSIKDAIGEKHLKVIIESGMLKEPWLIYKASMIAMQSGADFIKTSTGKTDVAATPEAAWVMCNAIKDFLMATGKKVGFKPAGGITSPADVSVYYSIVKSVLGNEWISPALFRIGASRLANNLLSLITGQELVYF